MLHVILSHGTLACQALAIDSTEDRESAWVNCTRIMLYNMQLVVNKPHAHADIITPCLYMYM